MRCINVPRHDVLMIPSRAMRVRLSTVLALLLLTSCGASEPTGEDDSPLLPVPTVPPVGGTIFIDPDIITS